MDASDTSIQKKILNVCVLIEKFFFLWCQGLSEVLVFLAAGGTPHPLQVIVLFQHVRACILS